MTTVYSSVAFFSREYNCTEVQKVKSNEWIDTYFFLLSSRLRIAHMVVWLFLHVFVLPRKLNIDYGVRKINWFLLDWETKCFDQSDIYVPNESSKSRSSQRTQRRLIHRLWTSLYLYKEFYSLICENECGLFPFSS